MKRFYPIAFNIGITVIIMAICFFAGILLQTTYTTDSLLTSIFVLGAFLTSLLTDWYIYGITFSLVGVVAVNFAFMFPYFSINFSIPENLVAAIIMIIVAVVTCTLTTKLKKQETIRIQAEKERRTELRCAVILCVCINGGSAASSGRHLLPWQIPHPQRSLPQKMCHLLPYT